MVLTDYTRELVRDDMKAHFIYGGVGLATTTPDVIDAYLFGGGTTIDACDATTSWTKEADMGTITLNTTAGAFKQGTGCLNLPTTYSTGTAGAYKTITSANLTGTYLAYWFYIDNIAELISSSTTLTTEIGTSGFTNTNKYYNAKTELKSGWNPIVIDIASPDAVGGSGATLATIDRLKVTIQASVSQGATDMRIDYFRFYSPNTLGITDALGTLTKTDLIWGFKTTHQVTTTMANGLDITESGDNDGIELLSRQTFAPVTKGSSTELQIDKYYYIE